MLARSLPFSRKSGVACRKSDKSTIGGNTFFFSIQHLAPGLQRIANGAPGVRDSDAIAVAKLDLLELARPHVRVSIEPRGVAADGMFLISPNVFGPGELSRMFHWTCDPVNYYDFGIEVPAALREAIQQVARKLTSCGESGYSLPADEHERSEQLAALRHLEQCRIVHCLRAAGAETVWVLTQAGLDQLQISMELHRPSRLLVVRPEVPVRERHVWELNQSLLESGWTCRIYEARTRGKGNKPVPYKEDESKEFWIRRGQRRLQHAYLLALVLASEHKHEVPHFQPNAFYMAIVDGKPPPTKKRRTRQREDEFDFGGRKAAAGHPVTVAPAAKCRQSTVKRSTQALDAGDGPCASSSSGSCGDDMILSSAASSSGSDDDSCAESSSEGSSSVKSHASACAGAEAGTSEGGAPTPRLCTPLVHRVSADSSEVWGKFLFTQVWHRTRRAECIGWQVTCSWPNHVLCRKTGQFQRHGGVELLERKLKHWCLQGAGFPDKESHLHECPLVEEPPTLEQLEFDLRAFS